MLYNFTQNIHVVFLERTFYNQSTDIQSISPWKFQGPRLSGSDTKAKQEQKEKNSYFRFWNFDNTY